MLASQYMQGLHTININTSDALQASGHKQSNGAPEAQQHSADKSQAPCREQSLPDLPSTQACEKPFKLKVLYVRMVDSLLSVMLVQNLPVWLSLDTRSTYTVSLMLVPKEAGYKSFVHLMAVWDRCISHCTADIEQLLVTI